MKDVKEALYHIFTTDSTLSSLVGNKVYTFWPDVVTVFPCITFFEVSSNQAGAKNLWQSTYQVDVWGKGSEVDSIAERIIKILNGQTITVNNKEKCFAGSVDSAGDESNGNIRRKILTVNFYLIFD